MVARRAGVGRNLLKRIKMTEAKGNDSSALRAKYNTRLETFAAVCRAPLPQPRPLQQPRSYFTRNHATSGHHHSPSSIHSHVHKRNNVHLAVRAGRCRLFITTLLFECKALFFVIVPTCNYHTPPPPPTHMMPRHEPHSHDARMA
jgi:hypothetical protein